MPDEKDPIASAAATEAPAAPASDDLGDDDLPQALKAEEKAFSVQILQFFLFPLLLVVTCLAIFFIFGVAGQSESRIDDLLVDLRQGGLHARRVAAHELARRLSNDYLEAKAKGKEPALAKDPRLADALLDALREAKPEEADLRVFLFMAGSQTGDHRFAPLAIDALQEYYADPAPKASTAGGAVVANDVEVQLYMALSRLAAPSSVEPLRAFYEKGDVDTQKLVVHAIGGVDSPEAEAFLLEALENEAVNVSWNAATRLAARKNAAAKRMVLKLLDPAYVKSAPGITPAQTRDWLQAGCAAAATFGAEEFRPSLKSLADGYDDVRVVDSARKALERLDQAKQ